MQPTIEIDSKTAVATDLTNDKETWSERQKDGETGNTGEKGKDGSKNNIKSKVEYTILPESSLFSTLIEIHSLA